ncbi:RGS22 protein, partial [Atractosteus spatula]|nr:RGS22 protein [Atractosteus spatula]
HYLNLSFFFFQQTFPEAIKFNKDTGGFEVVTDAAEVLTNQIKALLSTYKSPHPRYDGRTNGSSHSACAKPSQPCGNIIDNSYSVMCLDREQGIQWIQKERLPLFLQSDCYFEYRYYLSCVLSALLKYYVFILWSCFYACLISEMTFGPIMMAKLLSQLDESSLGLKLQVDPAYRPWRTTGEVSAPAPEEDENETIMTTFYVSLGQASIADNKEWFTLAKQSQTLISTPSLPVPLCASGEGLSCRGTTGSTSAVSSLAVFFFCKRQIINVVQVSEKSHANILKSDLSKRIHALTVADRRPKSVDDSCFACVPDSPSHSPSTVLMDCSCESGIECDKEEEEAWGLEDGEEAQFMETPSRDLDVSELSRALLSRTDGAGQEDMDLKEPTVQEGAAGEASDAPGQQRLPPSEDAPAPEKDRLEVCSKTSESEDGAEEEGSDLRRHVFSCGKGLEQFKTFLQGTPGEKHLSLWMDIERLKIIKDTEKRNRHLYHMRSRYMLSSGQSYLNTELLSRLALSQASCWMEKHLQQIQPKITEPLLLYWGPRFCLAHASPREKVAGKLRLWRERQLRPPLNIDPHPRTVTLLPLRPKSCVPRIGPQVRHTRWDPGGRPALTIRTLSWHHSSGPKQGKVISLQSKYKMLLFSRCSRSELVSPKPRIMLPASLQPRLSSLGPVPSKTAPTLAGTPRRRSCSPVLGGRRMERMLQALHHERRAGHCFTNFCELSRNKLWKNGIRFWFDLQEYHRLFYQEGLDPYRLQRQAHFLYSTYICFGAPEDTGVSGDSRRQICARLDPPFEELFDPAEEHVLSLLLEPWARMTTCDRSAYQKVEVVEEIRQLDSVHYRELKALHENMLCRANENVPDRNPPSPPPEVAREPELWDLVPEDFRGYSLGTLLRHRLELEHFRTFLEEHFASMDLLCWLDIEQFRRMPHKDKAKREEKSKDIKNKYLNKKYFFGANSPATRDQQEEVMRLGGGWGRILHDRLSAPILVEVQRHARRRLEKKWLPLFLATPQFAERQRTKALMKDVAEDQIFLRHRKKREVWKVTKKWKWRLIYFKCADVEQLLSLIVHVQEEVLAATPQSGLASVTVLKETKRSHVSLKGDYLENGVLFWLEVQKYKDLCHSHCDEATIQSKVTTIVDCFINSSIPPAVQIDIPPEQAHAILERRRELGPYVFREAQMTVFSVLFKLWPQFCAFRSNLEEETVLPALERKRERQRERLQRRMKEEERRAKEQEEAKRKSSFAEDFFGDEESVYSGSQDGRDSRRENGAPAYRIQQVSWSYSKYLEALEQEEALLHRYADVQSRAASPSLSSDAGVTHEARSDAGRLAKQLPPFHSMDCRSVGAFPYIIITVKPRMTYSHISLRVF